MNKKLKMGFVVASVVVLSAGVAWSQGAVGKQEAGTKTSRAPGDTTVYVPIVPCRVVDTRQGGGGAFGPGDQDSFRVYDDGSGFAEQGGSKVDCGIGGDSVAVEASITAVAPTATGFLRAFPTGVGVPQATTLNYTKGVSTTNTGAITVSDTDPDDLTLKNYGGPVDYVIDIQGYYVTVALAPA